MSSNTRKFPGNSTRPNASQEPFSTTQSPSRRTSRGMFEGNSTSGTTKPARLQVGSRAKTDDRSVDPQTMQKMLKFRTNILALDPYAKFPVDGDHRNVIHSKCGGQSKQKAIGDTSNFKEHISICKGPHTFSNDNSPLKSSLRGAPALSIHSTTVTPARPAQLTCPGFSFEEMFGKGFNSLLSHEHEQVTRAAKAAGIRLPRSKKESSVFSLSCLKKSLSHQEPVQPCDNCSKVLELSKFKDTLRGKTPKPNNERYTPFRSM